MEEQKIYRFPILTINDVKPVLRKDAKVLSYSLNATTKNGSIVNLYINNSVSLSDYIGHKMECLLEITRGEFEYRDDEGKIPQNVFVFQYLWQKRLFEYLPELNKIKDTLSDAYEEEEDSIQQLFENKATELFESWGLNGLNMGIYQSKPLLSSTEGFFLLNEYEFEEDIENLELNDEVYIRIDEIFLRGIRPCDSSDDPKQKKLIAQAKQTEESMQQMQKEEPKEKKKGRFDSLLDLD
ncbi:MAG: hypothetical protein ABIO55_10825 [Ginsengibacter sp.]